MSKEDTIILMLNRLFWLVTQTPGVARYSEDVKLFTEAASQAGVIDKEQADRIMKSYKC